MKWIYAALIAIVLTACSANASTYSGEYPAAHRYLEDKGYEVLSYEGHVASYQLTRRMLVEPPYMLAWGLQPVNVDDYIGAQIEVDKYVVRHHPLQDDSVDVYVYQSEGRPFGGISFPHNNSSAGGGWSIDGLTLEQLQPLPYPDWSAAWLAKYKN
ncbi:hypothetical protein [Paenibacillus kobensis]|uniref:hypothetical protein n=1 Tax=Paenibacillus kobensis TaxID=59841 RepID=UPI000FD6C30E|nr:hypothetical protein [Paenibacillus kobensis]